jgi:2-keto-4-pentenoate hydratase/2-oxohepta-3-ene-1,7-dioic acid hydratase in catechol pathway
MQLITFRKGDRVSYGVVTEGGIVDVGWRLGKRLPDLKAVLAQNALGDVAEVAATVKPTIRLEEIDFLPVIPNPDKILCAGLNYEAHRLEMERPKDKHVTLFARYPDTIVGHNQHIIRPAASGRYDFEGEIAVVIGRAARNVSRDSAMNHVAGYTCFMDGSVRDYQNHTAQYTPGKNFLMSGAMGPWLVTADTIGDPRKMTLTTRVNGKVMQEGVLGDLTFPIAEIIEYISRWTRLLPGDVISTGTPGGVGNARKPPVFLRSGDVVEVEAGGVGILRNPVRDEPPGGI